MTRWIAVFGCVLTVALTAPVGNQAEAARKRCIAPASHGAKMTWVCKRTEKCCRDAELPGGMVRSGALHDREPAPAVDQVDQPALVHRHVVARHPVGPRRHV